MAVYKCSVCDTEFDEEKEGKKWNDIEDDWACHVCESGKSLWSKIEDGTQGPDVSEKTKDASGSLDEYKRLSDDLEAHMADIHEIAETGGDLCTTNFEISHHTAIEHV